MFEKVIFYRCRIYTVDVPFSCKWLVGGTAGAVAKASFCSLALLFSCSRVSALAAEYFNFRLLRVADLFSLGVVACSGVSLPPVFCAPLVADSEPVRLLPGGHETLEEERRLCTDLQEGRAATPGVEVHMARDAPHAREQPGQPARLTGRESIT